MLSFIQRWLDKRAVANELAPLQARLARINELEANFKGLALVQLRGKVDALRQRVSAGELKDELLDEAFAAVREAAFRVLGLRPYDTQVLGALALVHGRIAEMGTGEGKTLLAPFVAFFRSLDGGVTHVHTANEFLAQRDANAMLPLYKFLGLNVGVSLNQAEADVKRKVYSCDVVYGTHQVFAQDFLTGHLVRYAGEELNSRGLGLAIVDEADAAFIDDARMPVVLSVARKGDVAHYTLAAQIADKLVRAADADSAGDFYVDAKDRIALLTDAGYNTVTELLKASGALSTEEDLFAYEHAHLLHKISAALTARHIYFKGQHYLVQDEAIVLVDETTGRLLPGRRLDHGMSQALEAKEGLTISPESMVLARITLQSFYREYQALCGMTGTAQHDAEELANVYGLRVVPIPPNKPSIRIDEPDRFYRTEEAKLEAVIQDVMQCHGQSRPVLVGTSSVEQSERLSQRLKDMGIKHEVLNASEHAREAEIIAAAGEPGAVTISTNMSGRGVDITLGGNVNLDLYRRQMAMGVEAWNEMDEAARTALMDELKASHAKRASFVRDCGGLRVIGLERYESRRQDRQLRGRCARQGDPGSTCFYLSLEDTMVENFAGERIRSILAVLDVKPGDEYEGHLVSAAIEGAQRQVEGRLADIRKSLTEFDDVFDKQRRAIYDLRNRILKGTDAISMVSDVIDEQVREVLDVCLPDEEFPEQWDIERLRTELTTFGLKLPELGDVMELQFEQVERQVLAMARAQWARGLEQVEPQLREGLARFVALEVLDYLWWNHLSELDVLRRSIHLRVHAKVNPRQAYAQDAYALFEVLWIAFKVQLASKALTFGVAQHVEHAPV